ncbi:hypothetical protein BH10BDE1_BH10BDE1_28400 [soil metagenome]
MSTPSVMWNCETTDIPSEGLTVGTPFQLNCSGTEVPDFNTKSFSLELEKLDRYRLRILENKGATTSGVQLIVTGYVPGDSPLKDPVLTDGQNRIGLNGIKFDFKSVIKQGEEAKPFASVAPVRLMWPKYAIGAIAGFALLVVLILAYVIQRRRSRKKFQAWLKQSQTPMSSFDQLNKDLRRASKDRNPVSHVAELEKITRTFLSRSYEAPLMSSSAKAILKVISRGDKRTRAKLAPLTIRLFGEFERVSESLSKAQLNAAEALNTTLPQIHELVREFGERVQAEQQKRRRNP